MSALIEPFFYCLLASLIWTPAIFITASLITGGAKDEGRVRAVSEKVWPAALILAALPVLLTPVVATFGLSLRAPAPLSSIAELYATTIPTTIEPVITAGSVQNITGVADILRIFATLYFYGFLMLLALAAVRHIWFAYRLNYALKLDEPRLEAALNAWRIRIGVKRRPRYVFSHIVSSICVYGVFRPVIVMPMHLLDRVSIKDAALMGAHEMAHIKRGDVMLFALCSAARTVFWFNPFMHQICARATLAAEQCADALVLARSVNRRQYAHCFVQGLRLAAGARTGFTNDLVPSFTPSDKRSRRERLNAILSGAPVANTLSITAKTGLGAGALIAATLAFVQAAFAVAAPVTDVPSATAQAPVTKVRIIKKIDVQLAAPATLDAISISSDATKTKPAHAHELNKRNARKLERKLQRMKEGLRKQFNNFNAFTAWNVDYVAIENKRDLHAQREEALRKAKENVELKLKEIRL